MYYDSSDRLAGEPQASNVSRRKIPAVADWENEGGLLAQSTQGDGAGASADFSRDVASQARFALFDAIPVGVLVSTEDGVVSYSNRAAQAMLGLGDSQLLGVRWSQLVDARDRASIPDQCLQGVSDSQNCVFDARLVGASGRRFWAHCRIASLGLSEHVNGQIHLIEGISTAAVSEPVGAVCFETLSHAVESARLALERVGDAVISTDANGRVLYLNAGAELMTGWSRQAACGMPLNQVFQLIDPDSGQPAECRVIDGAVDEPDMLAARKGLIVQRDGCELAIEQLAVPIRDWANVFAGTVVIFRDQRLSTECMARMAHLARHDELTGLPNRVALSEHFDQALKLARRHRNRVGLLFIDLDGFKQINDQFGHKVGDEALQTFAHTLTACVRSTDLVCRYGGDEFVVLLSEIGQADDAAKVADAIYEAAAKTVHCQGHAIKLEPSVGISLFPDHGDNADALLSRADAAMYQAKREDCQRHCLSHPDTQYPLPGVASHMGVVRNNGASVSQRTDSHGANGR